MEPFSQGDAEMIVPNIFSCLLMLSRKQVGKSVYTSPKQYQTSYRLRRFHYTDISKNISGEGAQISLAEEF